MCTILHMQPQEWQGSALPDLYGSINTSLSLERLDLICIVYIFTRRKSIRYQLFFIDVYNF